MITRVPPGARAPTAVRQAACRSRGGICRDTTPLPQRPPRPAAPRPQPAVLGEPDGVASLATGEVVRLPRFETGDRLQEKTVRLCGPEEFLLPVPLVPGVTVHGRRLRLSGQRPT